MNAVMIFVVLTLLAVWLCYRVLNVVGTDTVKHAGSAPKSERFVSFEGRIVRGVGSSSNTLEIDA